MDVRVPEYVIAVAEEASLAQAAEKLHISPSALSQSLSRLESELGRPLFLRSGGRWTPTEAGRIYLDGAREMLAVKEAAYRDIQRLALRQKKDVRVVICEQAYMLHRDTLLPTLHRALPGVRLELHQADSRQAAEYLLSDVADIAILCSRNEGNSLLIYRALYTETLSLAVPENLSWPGTEIDFERVRALPFVLPTENTFFHEIVADALTGAGVAVNTAYRSENVEGIARLVEHGYGLALLPARVAGAVRCRSYPWPGSAAYTVAVATLRYGSGKRNVSAVAEAIRKCFE